MPDVAIFQLDRPPIMLELSDRALRAKIREALGVREREIAAERKGKPFLGMKAALKIHWSRVPAKGKTLFELALSTWLELKLDEQEGLKID